MGAPPGPAAAPSIGAPTVAPSLDDDGFGNDAEPGSPLSALAHAMSAPPPTTADALYANEASAQATTLPDGDAEIIDDDFVIARPPNAFQNLLAILTSSRRNMAIAAGAAGLLVIGSALAFCGGGSSSERKQVAASETATTNATPKAARPEPAPEPAPAVKPASREPVAPAAAPTEPEASAPTAEELAAAREPAEATEPTSTTPEAGGAGTKVAQSKRDTRKPNAPAIRPASTSAAGGGPKLGGKQVVLEYDAQARESKPVASAPKSEQAAIQKARVAYASGNQRLFAGDANGAIKFYRQSLGSYPGYVAGYRGLGLAYAQQGDKPKALQALRMYVGSVPTAKDAPLIRKRISSLQGQ